MIIRPNFPNCLILITFIVISETKIQLIAHQVSSVSLLGHIILLG